MIKLKDEERRFFQNKIISYFKTEYKEEIGFLAADLFLDFILENFAEHFYNKGVISVKSWLSERFDDIVMDIDSNLI